MDYVKIRKKRSLPKHPRYDYDEDGLAVRRTRNLRRQIRHFNNNSSNETKQHKLLTQRNSGLQQNLNIRGLDKGGLDKEGLNKEGLNKQLKNNLANHKSFAFDHNKIVKSFINNLVKEYRNIPKSNQIPYTLKPFDLANTPPGTHIMADSHFDIIHGPSIPITHHGIYLGDGKVIHYTTNPDNTNMLFDKGKVFVDSIEDFTDDISKIRAVEYPDGLVSRSTEDIINAALSREGEAKYNVLFNNCEQFANKSITGKAVSNQVERWVDLANRTVVPVGKAIYSTGVKYGVDKLWDVIDHYPQERVDQVGEKIGKTIGGIGGEFVSKTIIDPIPIVGPILGPPVSAISEKMGEVIGGRYHEIPTAFEKVGEFYKRKAEEEGTIDPFRIFGLSPHIIDLMAIIERMITGESKLFEKPDEHPGGEVFSGSL